MVRLARLGTTAALLLLGVAGAQAQISLSTAVALALKNDPRMKVAEADVKKSEASLEEARAVYVPTIEASGGYGKSIGPPLSVPVAFSLSSQSLVFNFSQKDNVRAAAGGLRAAQLSAQDMHDQIAEDIVNTYVALDNAEQRLTAMNAELGHAERLATIVQQRLDAGDDTRIELLKAKRTVAEIHLLRLRTEDEIATLNDHLTLSTGLTRTLIATVPGSIPAMDGALSAVPSQHESYGVQASFEAARSKQESAFGEARYRYLPQVIFGANYSRIDTSQGDYVTYYPDFKSKSYDAVSAGLQFQFPILDRSHQAKAHEAAAEAARSRAEARSQQNQFLEGRDKLRRSTEELAARKDVSELDYELAQEQVKTVAIQLSSSSSDAGAAVMTPKDEQNAQLQERQRYVDLLNAQLELRQAEVNLMRQNGSLDAWLAESLTTPTTP